VNSSTTIGELTDGTSNVILVAERRIETIRTNLQITDPITDPVLLRSADGWAWGGPATMFSTRNAPNTGIHFDEADSPHDTIVNVLLGDASVRGVSFNIDLRTWNNLGNMSQGAPVNF